jgi:ABC-type sugar transport system permease subunit
LEVGNGCHGRVREWKRKSRLHESLYAYGYIAPAVVAMVVASFIPIAFTVLVAFTNWDESHNALVEGFTLSV